ncbi:MAG: hypothetical protein ACYSTN_08615 [Planctomycetota bacterium]
MNQQRILEELLALLETSSVTIRQEPLGGSGGGLCTVKGEEVSIRKHHLPRWLPSVLKPLQKLLILKRYILSPRSESLLKNISIAAGGQSERKTEKVAVLEPCCACIKERFSYGQK